MADEVGLSTYAKWRSGKSSLWALATVCGVWGAWNLIPGLPHFDDGMLGRLTAMLSIEASLMASVLLAYMQRQDASTRATLVALKEMAEAQCTTLRALAEYLLPEGGDGAPDHSANDRVDSLDPRRIDS